MNENFKKITEIALEKIKESKSPADLENIRIEFLGKKSEITQALRSLEKYSGEERKMIGKEANIARGLISKTLEEAAEKIAADKYQDLAETERIDVTLPGKKMPEGHLHLVTFAIREIMDIFTRIGFYRARYREVDNDWHTFESLNMPPDHAARDEWETFFVQSEKNNIVLTPHTSNGQVPEMLKGKLPIRMINIGRCYRRQADISHSPMFHQFEGLLVDKKVSIGDLTGTIDYFVKNFFGPKRTVRLRPFHFRFTEPSFEIDISCDICNGTGKLVNGEKCRLCKEGWLELGGAGMVHPNVLRAGKIDPKKYSGFAFGWGVERVMMMKGGLNIPDIRILYENDLRFLEQF